MNINDSIFGGFFDKDGNFIKGSSSITPDMINKIRKNVEIEINNSNLIMQFCESNLNETNTAKIIGCLSNIIISASAEIDSEHNQIPIEKQLSHIAMKANRLLNFLFKSTDGPIDGLAVLLLAFNMLQKSLFETLDNTKNPPLQDLEPLDTSDDQSEKYDIFKEIAKTQRKYQKPDNSNRNILDDLPPLF